MLGPAPQQISKRKADIKRVDYLWIPNQYESGLRVRTLRTAKTHFTAEGTIGLKAPVMM